MLITIQASKTKLSALQSGDKFVLVREGRRFIKGGQVVINGKSTQRYYVTEIDINGNEIGQSELHFLCQVELLNDTDITEKTGVKNTAI